MRLAWIALGLLATTSARADEEDLKAWMAQPSLPVIAQGFTPGVPLVYGCPDQERTKTIAFAFSAGVLPTSERLNRLINEGACLPAAPEGGAWDVVKVENGYAFMQAHKRGMGPVQAWFPIQSMVDGTGRHPGS